jgi:UDPglucose 6-dehydrogenase
MAVIADRCPGIQVTVVDLNAERIAAWNDPDLSELPVYEPGLDAVVGRCRGRNLHFSTAVEAAIAGADLVFLSVNTPTKTKGQCPHGGPGGPRPHDRGGEEHPAGAHGGNGAGDSFGGRGGQELCGALQPGISGGGQRDRGSGGAGSGADRRRRSAGDRGAGGDLWPVGAERADPRHQPLAQRISSINSIAALCEATGADVREVAKAIGADSRIGPKFLQAGPGFGGSCFQKDILNLVYLCRHYRLEAVAAYWEQVVTLNHWQQQRIARLVITKLFGTVSGKRIGVLGFAFKADTNDTRESPAIRICCDLLEEGAILQIVDPKVSERQLALDLGQASAPPTGSAAEGSWHRVPDVQQAASGADALLLLTEWQQFAAIDWPAVAAVMRQPAWLFDARAKADASAARAAGLQVWRVGESSH